jgi:hypothetical protein
LDWPFGAHVLEKDGTPVEATEFLVGFPVGVFNPELVKRVEA